MHGEFQVVKRDTIPPITSADAKSSVEMRGELRDFRWNDHLREFMPAAARLSVGWLGLKAGERLQMLVCPTRSLVVVYAGGGQMTGDVPRSVTKDDVVVIPAGCRYGFTGGPDGLQGVSIALGEGFSAISQKISPAPVPAEHTYGALLAYNDERLKEFEQRPIFESLVDGTLGDFRSRSTYQWGIQLWNEGARALLLARAVSCVDPFYRESFQADVQSEPVSLTSRGEGQPVAQRKKDAVLEAISDWFVHQMYVLDNAEKAALGELVVKQGLRAYQRRAARVLGEQGDPIVGAANDAPLWIHLLQRESSSTYARLRRRVTEGWDMLGAMTDRIVELTRCEQ